MKKFSLIKAILLVCMLISSPLYAEVKLDINTATVEQLADGLKGIGMSKAKAIVKHREAHGPFTSLDELIVVKGIGAATVDKNRERMSITAAE